MVDVQDAVCEVSRLISSLYKSQALNLGPGSSRGFGGEKMCKFIQALSKLLITLRRETVMQTQPQCSHDNLGRDLC